MRISSSLSSVLTAAALAACGGGSSPAPAPPTAAVAHQDLVVPTASADRVLPTTAWYPNGDATKLPVVVMSHGLGGHKGDAAFLAERIAAAGYLVLAPDHPADGVDKALQRPTDVAAVLDLLADGKQPLHERADLDHVAVYGHSFGGFTALALAGGKPGSNPEWTAACTAAPTAPGCPAPTVEQFPAMSLRDARVDVVIVAAPAGYFQLGVAGTQAVETPVLVLAAGKDEITPPATQVAPLFAELRTPKAMVTLPLAGHMTFVALCDKLPKLAECAPSSPLSLTAAHGLIGDAVVGYLDQQIKNRPAPDYTALARARAVDVEVR